MHHTETNLIEINNKIKNKINSLSLDQYNPKVIAVSKTFKEQDILPLLDYGHCDFGENKVQEALLKWPNLKEKYKNVKLHMLGKLQTNKAKFAVEIFDYIHSLDSQKLAEKIADQQIKKSIKVKTFIQINIGNVLETAITSAELLFVCISLCIAINLLTTSCINFQKYIIS